MFTSSKATTDENIKTASDMVYTYDATLGGTEMYAPLKAAIGLTFQQKLPRIIFLLSDGSISNSNQVISLVKNNSNIIRLHCVGIGNGISSYFITEVAKAGKGISEFVKDDDVLENKTMYILQAAFSPYLTSISVTVNPAQYSARVFPIMSDSYILLKNEPFYINIFFSDAFALASSEASPTVSLAYQNSLTGQLFQTNFVMMKKNAVNGTVNHKIGYNTFLNYLNDIINMTTDNNDIQVLKKILVDYSVKFQVLTTSTAFLCIIQENNISSNSTVQVQIPTISSSDYSSNSNPSTSTGSTASPSGTGSTGVTTSSSPNYYGNYAPKYAPKIMIMEMLALALMILIMTLLA